MLNETHALIAEEKAKLAQVLANLDEVRDIIGVKRLEEINALGSLNRCYEILYGLMRQGTLSLAEAKIGVRVKTLREFSGVPAGTEGVIVEDYGTGITIAWDLPDKPYPKDMSCEAVAKLYAVNPKCPLRDGFDKQKELHHLARVQ